MYAGAFNLYHFLFLVNLYVHDLYLNVKYTYGIEV